MIASANAPSSLPKRGLHRRHGLGAAPKLTVDELNHSLGVGIALERRAVALQFLAQFAEVLDNAVVHHAHARRGMGMRVALDGLAVRGPPRMADAAASIKRLGGQLRSRAASLPSARRLVRTPPSMVATPAES